MANRNLADEVDALAKGLASLRAANTRTVSRVRALEDRELQAAMPPAAVTRARQIATNIASSYEDLPSQLKQDLRNAQYMEPRRTLLQRIRKWLGL